MNITEKVLARASGEKEVQPGEIIEVEVDLAMSHDGTSPPTINTFNKIAEQVWDPEKIVMVFDHNLPANTMGSAEFQKVTRDFVRRQGIKNFYTHGEGICHQVLPEEGLIKPGMVVVGADSHTCTYGAFGAFATGMGATDLAVVYATGKTWFMVPGAFKIEVDGILREYVTAKDLILHIIGSIGSYGATYKTLEFCGSTVQNMDVAGRMTMCNMAVEAGAKNGIMEPNQAVLKYLKERNVENFQIFTSDPDSTYEKSLHYSVDDLEPQVACPHNVDNVYPVSQVSGESIDQAFIGSCTNGRLEDLRIAAQVLENRKVHPDVRLIVSPASRRIYQAAIAEGIIETFLDAGAIIINPGCGPCLGAHMGVLTAGEVCISTTNRNFVGRMGDPQSEVYLANPAVVAYSAIHGEIRNPSE
ncbi:MAG: methanogen homoaconitase large subunit [Methanobacterium sp.]|jgi:methanogen homoaconitase large subunit|uniref:homoaconitase large subunit n=1 Tax=Methanobacterium sp. TaxID=2164 RepID=UPI0003C9757F|nr:homoaconitase large subunit [Methanobacterium sp.]MDI3550199.1 methanogen homoaconitase large subunit [Methanobacterium sp.]CDG64400.1 3-isopropylmalate dehydratase large subunit 2 [Methanobacterium sp. MB1]